MWKKNMILTYNAFIDITWWILYKCTDMNNIKQLTISEASATLNCKNLRFVSVFANNSTF